MDGASIRATADALMPKQYSDGSWAFNTDLLSLNMPRTGAVLREAVDRVNNLRAWYFQDYDVLKLTSR